LDDGEEGDAVEEDEDGGGGDDNDMEVGELEDEEEEDSDYSSGYSLGYDEEQFAADLEEVDSVGENLQKNAEEDGEGRQHTNPAVASCCVCMERWTSGGAHRIWYKHFVGSDPYFHSAYKKSVMCLQLHSVWPCVRQVMPGEVASPLWRHHCQG
jgi:hypothetical protein